MGQQEWDAYEQLKLIYRSGESKVKNASHQNVPRRHKIIQKRREEAESIAEFCQTQVLNMEDRKAWVKEANLWLGRKSKLEREEDELLDQMGDELPLPDRERKNGKWVDIEY